MNPRCAHSSDLNTINELIRESKAYWGYSEFFLNQFMEKWGIKDHYLHTNEVILFEQEGQLIGLFSFKINNDNEPDLDLFFVARNEIGVGIGRTMWQFALQFAFERGWNEFKILADPNAEQFYKHMGAKTIGKFESFPNRFVPIMSMNL